MATYIAVTAALMVVLQVVDRNRAKRQQSGASPIGHPSVNMVQREPDGLS